MSDISSSDKVEELMKSAAQAEMNQTSLESKELGLQKLLNAKKEECANLKKEIQEKQKQKSYLMKKNPEQKFELGILQAQVLKVQNSTADLEILVKGALKKVEELKQRILVRTQDTEILIIEAEQKLDFQLQAMRTII